MAVLLIAEHNNKELKPFTLNATTAASQIDASICDAAVVAFRVKGFNSLLLCSAINKTAIILPLLHFSIFEPTQIH